MDAQATQTILAVLSVATGKSKSELRRLAEQNGIHILQGSTYVPLALSSLTESVSGYPGAVLKVGKLSYFKLNIRN